MEEAKLPQPNHSKPFLPDEQATRLQETVATLSAQVAQIERRLTAIEQTGHARTILNSLPERSTRPPLESRFGLMLVNRAGAITLAIGIIFFFKYAVDNKWIAAEGRVAIGVIAGLLMLGAAEWLRRRDLDKPVQGPDRSVFTQGIAGCGLATIYVSLYAAFEYYELIIPAAGWTLLVLTSALAVLLSVRYGSAAIAALGFAGGLLTPMLLHNAATAWWFDFLYLLLLGFTALAIAVRQIWPVLIPGLAALTVLAAGVLFNPRHPGWFVAFCVLLSAVHFLAIRFAHPTLKKFIYLTAQGYLLIASIRLVALWGSANSTPDNRYSLISALESLLLGIYGVLALIVGMARNSLVNRSLGLVLLGAVICKLYLWDVWQLSRFYRISAFVILGILLLTASFLYSRFRTRASE